MTWLTLTVWIPHIYAIAHCLRITVSPFTPLLIAQLVPRFYLPITVRIQLRTHCTYRRKNPPPQVVRTPLDARYVAILTTVGSWTQVSSQLARAAFAIPVQDTGYDPARTRCCAAAPDSQILITARLVDYC